MGGRAEGGWGRSLAQARGPKRRPSFSVLLVKFVFHRFRYCISWQYRYPARFLIYFKREQVR
jgi:hypothetical protein